MTPDQLLKTLQLNDTLFPTGGFAYSDGLETAVNNGFVTDAASLAQWLEHYSVSVFVPCDGLALRRAMAAHSRDDWETLRTLDLELTAMKPAASIRTSNASLGKRFLKSVTACHQHPDFERLERGIRNLPIVYAVVFSILEVDEKSALLSFAYTRLAAMISAALRLMAIGQQEAQSVLGRALEKLPAAVERIVQHGNAELTSFVPVLDIQQMNHRYLYSRLFRS